MDPRELTQYWVSYSGQLADDNGTPKNDDPRVSAFQRQLMAYLMRNSETAKPALLLSGEAEVVISAVFESVTDAEALSVARRCFAEAIDKAGGHSDLPQGPHPVWTTRVLLKRGTVVELAA